MACAFSSLIDSVEAKGILELDLARNKFTWKSAIRLAMSFEKIPMLQVLDLSDVKLKGETVRIAKGLVKSKVRLRKLLMG